MPSHPLDFPQDDDRPRLHRPRKPRRKSVVHEHWVRLDTFWRVVMSFLCLFVCAEGAVVLWLGHDFGNQRQAIRELREAVDAIQAPREPRRLP